MNKPGKPQKDLASVSKRDGLNHFLVLKKLELKTSQYNKPYLFLELGDKSAAMPAYIWEDAENIAGSIRSGSVVKVTGGFEEYKNQLQMKIASIRTATELDGVSIDDFLPVSGRDFDVMKRELENRIGKIKNAHLKTLLKHILKGDFYDKYLRAPAGKSWHHSYIHGLLEHTLEIVKICDFMCDIHSEINRDLLICGAILHDSGKVEELTFDAAFDYSDKGKLVGHIVLGALEISDKAGKIANFPEDLRIQLIHLILSHQGKLEYSSPVVPKTLESIVLYQADELSAKTNAYKSALVAEAGNPGKWTKYLSLIATSLYIPPDFGNYQEESSKTLFDV